MRLPSPLPLPVRRRLLVATAGLTLAGGLLATTGGPGSAAVRADWPAYQYAARHGSFNALATTITPTNAASLRRVWTWRPPAGTRPGQPQTGLYGSPAVVGGTVYVGSRTGDLFKLSLASGAVLRQRFIGFRPALSCGAAGLVSSPTVATDPVSGRLAVYLGAPDGFVYALRASDLSTLWRTRVATPSPTESDYFLWSSPTVANGRVYIGISSQCDRPLVDGAGVVAVRQAGGGVVGRYSSGVRGASVWSSVAVDPRDGAVFVTSGNPLRADQPGDAYSIVRLQGAPVNGRLVRLGKWAIPAAQQTFDADFGASPTLFTATLGGAVAHLVAACDKNGILYAWRRGRLADGPVWQRRIGIAGSDPNSCIGGAAYDGRRLYQGSNNTTVNGVAVPGSVRALDPATGAVLWQRQVSNVVISTPTVDGAGVLAVATTDFGSSTNHGYLLDAATGGVRRTVPIAGPGSFGQAVFADDTVLFPTIAAGMIAFRP